MNIRNIVDIVVPFKKLHEDAILPEYKTEGSAGKDCYAVGEPEIKPTCVIYKLGWACAIPQGHVGFLFPRSSNSKKDLLLSNSVGVIDADYRGEVQARFRDVSDAEEAARMYALDEAVCQLIVMPYPNVVSKWVDELDDTERGEGGFGSTTNKKDDETSE